VYHRVVDGAQSAQFLETSKNGEPGQPVNAMSASVTFSLKPVPSFRLDLTAWALRRRPSNVIDRGDGQTYRRALVLNSNPAEVAVAQSGPPNSPRLLGLRINLAEFYQRAAGQPKLGALVQRFCGFKPQRLPMVFEALANAIACQQMSLSLGILLLNRITEKFGVAVEGTAGIAHAFTQPEDLADLELTAFRQLGFSRQKGRSLIALARTCVDGRVDLEALADLNDKATTERWLEV
jgi:DNA-3-methyladenine glycosylase II